MRVTVFVSCEFSGDRECTCVLVRCAHFFCLLWIEQYVEALLHVKSACCPIRMVFVLVLVCSCVLVLFACSAVLGYAVLCPRGFCLRAALLLYAVH